MLPWHRTAAPPASPLAARQERELRALLSQVASFVRALESTRVQSLALPRVRSTGAAKAAAALLRARRGSIKANFISAKRGARALLEALAAEGGVGARAAASEAAGALLAHQRALRAADADIKAALAPQRGEEDGGGGGDESSVAAVSAAAAPVAVLVGARSAPLLLAAQSRQISTTAALRESVAELRGAQVAGAAIAKQLEENDAVAERIAASLDGAQGELAIARRLLWTFLARIYTDKVILGLTFLVTLGVLGIVVYAAVNPSASAILFGGAAPTAAAQPAVPPSSAPPLAPLGSHG